MNLEPFKKCTESCPLFGIVNEAPEGTSYGCYIGRVLIYVVKYNQSCKRKMNLKEKREHMKLKRGLERERDNITTRIYHLQLLIDNCGRE
jgi:hypothetical protein